MTLVKTDGSGLAPSDCAKVVNYVTLYEGTVSLSRRLPDRYRTQGLPRVREAEADRSRGAFAQVPSLLCGDVNDLVYSCRSSQILLSAWITRQ